MFDRKLPWWSLYNRGGVKLGVLTVACGAALAMGAAVALTLAALDWTTLHGADAPFLWIGVVFGVVLLVGGVAMCRDGKRHAADKPA
jgi:hypothetical protein